MQWKKSLSSLKFWLAGNHVIPDLTISVAFLVSDTHEAVSSASWQKQLSAYRSPRDATKKRPIFRLYLLVQNHVYYRYLKRCISWEVTRRRLFSSQTQKNSFMECRSQEMQWKRDHYCVYTYWLKITCHQIQENPLHFLSPSAQRAVFGTGSQKLPRECHSPRNAMKKKTRIRGWLEITCVPWLNLPRCLWISLVFLRGWATRSPYDNTYNAAKTTHKTTHLPTHQ